MGKSNCIIIEDEPLASALLAEFVGRTPALANQGVFNSVASAQAYLSTHPVELVFLDIHLPGKSGMDFLRELIVRPAVIITTAYPQYAVDGFELAVTDYLLKPFGYERFLGAVEKYLQNTRYRSGDYLDLMVQKKTIRLPFSEIRYIESQREYVLVVTNENVFRSRIGIGEIELRLPGNFQRIHRSFIVNKDRVTAYTAETVEIGKHILPVGRGNRGPV